MRMSFGSITATRVSTRTNTEGGYCCPSKPVILQGDEHDA